MNCPKCGKPIETSGGTHKCVYTMNAGSGSYGISGGIVGTVVEGRPDASEGRRVDSRPPSGGRAFSKTDDKGGFTVELSGVLDKGRANDRGEDGLLVLDGVRMRVQIVSVPADSTLWRDLSTIPSSYSTWRTSVHSSVRRSSRHTASATGTRNANLRRSGWSDPPCDLRAGSLREGMALLSNPYQPTPRQERSSSPSGRRSQKKGDR